MRKTALSVPRTPLDHEIPRGTKSEISVLLILSCSYDFLSILYHPTQAGPFHGIFRFAALMRQDSPYETKKDVIFDILYYTT